MMHERRPLAAVVLLALALPGAAWAQSPVQETRRRPPPLERAPECAIWKGTVSGNDPSVEIEMKLCPSGNAVSGMMQWSSLKSGWNRRAIEGRWSDDKSALTLRDTSVVESRPEPGWRFCEVDSYDLKIVSPGNLEGTYRSVACNDNAKVKLTLEPGTVPAEAPALPAPPPLAPPPATASPKETKRWLCSAGGPSAGTPWALLALGGALAAGRTLRSCSGRRAAERRNGN